MEIPSSDDFDEQKYQEWLAGKPARIEKRRQARMVGSLATVEDVHMPANPQSFIDKSFSTIHGAHQKSIIARSERADEFLADLDALLAAG